MRKEDIQRFNKFVDSIQGKVVKGDYEFMALCPAHGDARLSLWIKLDEKGKIQVDCKAGCSAFSVCESLGFDIQILYAKPQIVACYDYINLDGEMLYQEVKFDSDGLNKFKVRRKDKKTDEWVYDIKGSSRILYNLFQVTKAKDGEIIFMNEGAKDAKTLLSLGLTATAALFNDWAKTDTNPLNGKDVIIMVDNDEAGETKALAAAHDRYRRSKSIKLLRLPGLGKGGDVTDWLNMGGANTKEKLLELAASPELKEWCPQASVRDRVANGEMTGLAYEHNNSREIWNDWLEIFHPSEEGPLHFYDDSWLKGVPQELIYHQFMSENELQEQIMQFLLHCYNKQSKHSDEPFKPEPNDTSKILKSGELNRDLNVLANPSIPIFRPFFMSEKEKNYKPEDIIIMKSANFYIPERCVFPRNMESCVALHALPFDYDEKATCHEIEKSFNNQWPNDRAAINLFLQFLYYCMLNTHKWKAILCLIGPSDSGKSKKLDLIRHFIGEKSCEALSLSKIGNQFELHRARNAKILICDEMSITKQDLSEGSIVENLKSIPAGSAIRIEKKSGKIYSRVLPCQIIMAGNNPPIIPELSDALTNRFKFLSLDHVYIQGRDMNTSIVDIWIEELAGLMNLVLDAGLELVANDGFIEPASSAVIRGKFEGGGSTMKKFVRELFDVNAINDPIKWMVSIEDMKQYYIKFCEDEGIDQLRLKDYNLGLESISGVRRERRNINITDKTGKPVRKTIKCWIGLRRKGTSGIIGAKNNVADDEPAF